MRPEQKAGCETPAQTRACEAAWPISSGTQTGDEPADRQEGDREPRGTPDERADDNADEQRTRGKRGGRGHARKGAKGAGVLRVLTVRC